MRISTSPTIATLPTRSSFGPTVQSHGDSFRFSSHSNSKLTYGLLGGLGAVAGGAALMHFTSGLTGIAAHVAGGVAGAIAGGAVVGLTAGIIGGKTDSGFGGVAAAQGYAVVGAGLGLIGGAIGGAYLGVSSGNVPAAIAGGIAGGAAGLVFANGLTH